MNRGERLHSLFALIFFLIGIIVLRLFDIQILSHNYLYSRAFAQWQGISQDENRGGIFDRNGRSLLDSYKENYVFISPRWLKDTEIEYLKKNNLLSPQKSNKLQSIRLSSANMEVVKKLLGKTPGIFIFPKEMRYGENALATHVVGYRGKTGIERTFDHFLKGGKSKAGILYDGFGQPIPGASKKDVTDINWGVWLTIDSKMQSAVEKIMDEEIQKGAVVVMDARTGEILAMASRPNYKQYKLEAYLKREDAPLINRAVEAYIPGSIFKIIVLAAALEENVADLDDEFFCSGAKQVGGNIIRCNSYEKGGHGRISLRDAFAYSCNCAFIELGLRLGKVKILEYAEKFGLGKKVLGVLAEEKPGNIPSPQKIYQADLGNLSIGQGNLQITPLQATQMLLTVVRDGIRMTPVLVKKVVDSSGFEVQTELVIHDTEKIISTNTARKLQKALKAVVDYGTGTLSKPPNELFEVAGKTGTAELGDGNNHAWFVGYFPADNPRYIITVFIEKGQSGPLKAAPVFRKIAEEIYFLKGK